MLILTILLFIFAGCGQYKLNVNHNTLEKNVKIVFTDSCKYVIQNIKNADKKSNVLVEGTQNQTKNNYIADALCNRVSIATYDMGNNRYWYITSPTEDVIANNTNCTIKSINGVDFIWCDKAKVITYSIPHNLGYSKKVYINLLQNSKCFYDILETAQNCENPTSNQTSLSNNGLSRKNGQWITPSQKACTQNGGDMVSGFNCKANWESAKKICTAINAILPAIEELQEAVTNCKGAPNSHSSNDSNTHYQSCYKDLGFSPSRLYWSSTTHKTLPNNAFYMDFEYGSIDYYIKSVNFYVRCIKKN